MQSRSLTYTLEAKGITIVRISEPKQTETTQRWKLALQSTQSELPIPTKIEFSRRTVDESYQFEPVNSMLIHQYQMYPVLTNHYTKEAALLQKLWALHSRKETQARDIFDLKLLLDAGAPLPPQKKLPKDDIEQMLQNIASVSFAHFQGQVLAYLEAEYQKHYGSPQIWEQMQNQVQAVLKEQSR